MKFQVTEIDFDFTGCLETWGSYELPVKEQKEFIDQALNTIWDVDDEDDLVEKVTASTGWMINSIDYRPIVTS